MTEQHNDGHKRKADKFWFAPCARQHQAGSDFADLSAAKGPWHKLQGNT